MKKLLLTIILVCFAATAFGADVTVTKIINTVTIAAGASHTSKAIKLNDNQAIYFSLQATVADAGTSGTCKFEYLMSLNGIDYREPANASDIVSGITSASGSGSDGKIYYSFRPEPGKYMKIKVTETANSTNAVIVTVWLGEAK